MGTYVTGRNCILNAMRNLAHGIHHLEGGEITRLKLSGAQYTGTKVMPFKTFGATAAIETCREKMSTGTAVAPMATSGGVREPKAIGDHKTALVHLARLENKFTKGGFDALNPFSVEQAVMVLDYELAQERGLKDARPTSGIGSEVAISATVALLNAQAAFYKIPVSLAMRALLLGIQDKEMDVDNLVAPLPKFNILNFGGHSGTKRADGLPYVWIQETKVAPIGAKTFEEAVEMGREVLSQVIKIAKVDNVGFEAGISPALKEPEQIYEMASESIQKAGLWGKVVIAADAAASEFSDPVSEGSDKFLYRLYPDREPLDAEGMVRFWTDMAAKYPIVSIEDGMNSEDPIGWNLLMQALGQKIEIQGDDLFVTAAEEMNRLRFCANSVLVKPNQSGTILRTLAAIATARQLGFTISPSHRSGKVPGGYGIIPELCLGTQAEWIKPGAPRRERAGFLNNVITQIAELEMLGIPVGFAGPIVAQRFGISI